MIRESATRWTLEADMGRAFEQSPQSMLLADADDLRIVGSNAAMRRSSGFSRSELRSLSVADLFVRESGSSELVQQLRNPEPTVPLRAYQRRNDGRLLEVEITGYRVTDGRKPLLGFMTQDITLRSKFEERQRERQGRLAHHDPLTGLPNRLFLAAHLPNAIETARRNGHLLAKMFLDLDRFKHINDSRGHDAGDRLLQAVAQRIAIPPGRTTSSFAWFPRDGVDMGELLRHSNTAMYHAKDRGRNNCQMFSPSMDCRLRQRTITEAPRMPRSGARLERRGSPFR